MKKPIIYILCFITMFLSVFQPVQAADLSIPSYPKGYTADKYPILIISHDSTADWDYYYYYGCNGKVEANHLSDGTTLITLSGALIEATYRVAKNGKGEGWFSGSTEYPTGSTGFNLSKKGIVSSTHSIFLPDGTPVFQRPLVPDALEGLGETVRVNLVAIAGWTIFLVALVISLAALVRHLREWLKRS